MVKGDHIRRASSIMSYLCSCTRHPVVIEGCATTWLLEWVWTPQCGHPFMPLSAPPSLFCWLISLIATAAVLNNSNARYRVMLMPASRDAVFRAPVVLMGIHCLLGYLSSS